MGEKQEGPSLAEIKQLLLNAASQEDEKTRRSATGLSGNAPEAIKSLPSQIADVAVSIGTAIKNFAVKQGEIAMGGDREYREGVSSLVHYTLQQRDKEGVRDKLSELAHDKSLSARARDMAHDAQALAGEILEQRGKATAQRAPESRGRG